MCHARPHWLNQVQMTLLQLLHTSLQFVLMVYILVRLYSANTAVLNLAMRFHEITLSCQYGDEQSSQSQISEIYVWSLHFMLDTQLICFLLTKVGLLTLLSRTSHILRWVWNFLFSSIRFCGSGLERPCNIRHIGFFLYWSVPRKASLQISLLILTRKHKKIKPFLDLRVQIVNFT